MSFKCLFNLRKRYSIPHVLVVLFLGFSATHGCADNTAEDDVWATLKQGGNVVLIRHASTTGEGDPKAFKLDDCTIQRNLLADGRRAAKLIGEAFRSRAVPIGQVLSNLAVIAVAPIQPNSPLTASNRGRSWI